MRWQRGTLRHGTPSVRVWLEQRGWRGVDSSAGKEWLVYLGEEGLRCPLRHTRGLGVRTLRRFGEARIIRSLGGSSQGTESREGLLKILVEDILLISLTFLFVLCCYCLEMAAQG